MKLQLTAVILLLIVSTANAQLGKFLKEKAKSVTESGVIQEKIKDLASEKLADARAEVDSTSFSFAISVSDNSDLINADTGKDKAIKLISTFKSNEDDSEQVKARKLKDAGELAYAKGYYQKAEYLLLSAKTSYEESSTDDINYYTTISNLGLLYSTMGRFTKAFEFTNQALELRKENLGESSLAYGVSLNNLAVLQNETGSYNESESNITKAISVIESTSGKESMQTAIALNNKAMLYQSVGRFEDASELMKQVITISADIQSENSNNHQKFLSNQALLYTEIGDYQKAISIYKELIRIKERKFGTKHPDYAHMLNNLASVYLLTGEEGEVESLLKRAIDIYEDKFSKEHKLYASAISDLGNYYRYAGRFEEAKKLLDEALSINKDVLGEDHPDYAKSLEDLAVVEWKLGNYNEASDLFDNTLGKTLTFINSYFPPMSESEKTKYWDQLRPRFEAYYSFVFDPKNSLNELEINAYNYHIATKGLLLSSTNKIKNKILNSGDDELIERYKLWLDQKEMLAQYYSYSKEELAEQKINRDSLEIAANRTEKQLSQESKLFQEGYSLSETKWNDVQAKLASNECAVEVIRYRYFGRYLGEEIRYAAIVFGKEGGILTTVFENGAHLEGRYFKYYNNAIHQKLDDGYSYDQYWKPIHSLTAGKKVVYFSADGIFNQINLNGLKSDQGYVIDSYEIHYVGNTKFIGTQSGQKSLKTAFVLGNPSFGSDQLNPLPGTAKEVSILSTKLKAAGVSTKTYVQDEATENAVKNVKEPGLLHIATHGYFLQDLDNSGNKVFGVNVESARNNPLLRSGLLLSGAGNVLTNAAPMEGSNNGVLTAYEAINLNLNGTNLVVLSACETAVGDVKAGEGVYGLQRAFLGAGAQSLLMSLWKVDDAATQELMTNFYTNWLKSGNKRSAFNQAQKTLKQKYPHPYYWSSFVLVDN
ncbi:CHAT domain-containing protein [Fulvivirga lutea]|uniref:CHAT domain-containing protein n=1 Tax=Fulvivirga lutea TaxID=2810512 RepID=A0A974WE45_9BACT|nr:CHAT domain-containing tetratricopeptide repeat protein [Fulvivirga lutea]QSE95884.1 CHAT domain-containing protein [Fulvivirga lutea]